ncbi:MAG: dockerin type I domain-containing protein, partial [Pirellulales bacterium]
MALGCTTAWDNLSASAQTVLFSDQMNVGTGWKYSHFAGAMDPPFPTVSGQFNFDYAALGIPEAPNTAPGDAVRRGLRLDSNIQGGVAGDAIAAVYEDPDFTGKYTLQVDMWMNWSADVTQNGTTEHGGVYAGFDYDAAQGSFSPGQNGAGVMLSTDGDCSNCDYILAKSQWELDTFSGQYGTMDLGFGNQPGYDNTDGDASIAPDLETLFPSFDIAAATNNMNGNGPQPAGALGFQWVTVTIEVDSNAAGTGTNGSLGTAKVSLKSAQSGNSFVLGTIQNSIDDDRDDDNDGDECSGGEDICTNEQPVSMTGGIGLAAIDFFSSKPSNAAWGFMLFDNVRVFEGSLTVDVPGDYNDDGQVTSADYNAWKSTFGMNVTAGAGADGNNDGKINAADY